MYASRIGQLFKYCLFLEDWLEFKSEVKDSN